MTDSPSSTVTRLVDCALEIDTNGTVLSVDEGVGDLLGFRPDELCGRDVAEIVHDGDVRDLTATLGRLRDAPTRRERSLMLRCRRADGSWLPCEAPAQPSDSRAERIVLGLRGIGSHLDSPVLDAALDELAHRYGMTTRYDCILVLDPKGVITVIEDRVDCALGFDATQLVGQGIWEYVHPEDHEDAASAFARELATPDNREPAIVLRCRYAGGGWRWFEATARNRRDDPQLGGVVVGLREVGPPFGNRLWETLTTAEQDVVIAVTRGLSNQEIAAKRFTSVRTVEAQLASIYTKLQLSTRGQLLRRARDR